MIVCRGKYDLAGNFSAIIFLNIYIVDFYRFL